MTGTFGRRASLTHEESLVQQGDLYSLAGEITLAAGASYKIGFTSAKNFAFIHSHWRTAADRCRAYIYENTAYTGGSAKILLNRNRHLDLQAVTQVSIGVTATVSDPIASILFGNKAAGEASVDEELIFKKNTPYVLELLNDANSQSDAIFYYVACTEYDLP